MIDDSTGNIECVYFNDISGLAIGMYIQVIGQYTRKPYHEGYINKLRV